MIHGDQFDMFVRDKTQISKLGDLGYHFLIFVNKYYNKIRRLIKLEYHSLSKEIKVRVKGVGNFIQKFELACIKRAEEMNCDGVICGHIHQPSEKHINNVHYINLGCWTDYSNCTFAAEKHGEISLYKFNDQKKLIEKI